MKILNILPNFQNTRRTIKNKLSIFPHFQDLKDIVRKTAEENGDKIGHFTIDAKSSDFIGNMNMRGVKKVKSRFNDEKFQYFQIIKLLFCHKKN